MFLASVIIDLPTRALNRTFDYEVPNELKEVQVGCAVGVEFGARVLVGYVVKLRHVSTKVLDEHHVNIRKLKPLLCMISDPYFDEQSCQLAFWIAHEYICPVASAFHLFLPPASSAKIKRVDNTWRLVLGGVGPVDDRWVFLDDKKYLPPKNAVKQRAVLDALSAGGMRVAELACDLGPVNQVLKALEKHGAIHIEHHRRMRQPSGAMDMPSQNDVILTTEQEYALKTIARARKEGQTQAILIDGITGCGKTEIYLRAIAAELKSGRGALVLVPEISLTPQMVARFRARFAERLAVLHSRLSAGERFDQWDMVRSGLADVVVGTRSALFAPLKKCGLVIIDEEHDASYKQNSSPRYCAREVALELCRLRGATLICGSATPSIEALTACKRGFWRKSNWKRVVLKKRPSGQKLPQVLVVDMASTFKSGSRSMFSKELICALKEVYEHADKAVLFLNRRGFASFLLCRECGFVPECPNCAVSLTYHDHEQVLMCHHCGHTQPLCARCPRCGSPYLRKFGTGTERVASQLRDLVPADMPIVRMDADTTRGKGAHTYLLKRFAEQKGGILLGTQMITKGLDFPDVTLVGVICADTTLKLPDFRASERSFQLLEQVSGRAGRAARAGHVIIQTYLPEHPAVKAAAAHDRRIFLNSELSEREKLYYPPYSRLANVLIWGKDEEKVQRRATELALVFRSTFLSAKVDWRLLGPAPCVFSRLRGLTRWHILIKAPADGDFFPLLEPAMRQVSHFKGEVHSAVDVDPYSLL